MNKLQIGVLILTHLCSENFIIDYRNYSINVSCRYRKLERILIFISYFIYNFLLNVLTVNNNINVHLISIFN